MSKCTHVFTVVETSNDCTSEPAQVCALRSFRTLRTARAFCVELIVKLAQNNASFACMLAHDANHKDLLENLVDVTGRRADELDEFFDRGSDKKRGVNWLIDGLRQYLADEVGEQYYAYCYPLSYHLDILESTLD